MARGLKTGGRNFEKGKSGNPTGKRKYLRELTVMRKMTHEELASLADTLIQKRLPVEHLDDVVASSETNFAQKMFAAVVARAIRTGDYNAMKAIYELIFGKLEKSNVVIPVQSSEVTNAPNYSKLSIEELEMLNKIVTKANES